MKITVIPRKIKKMLLNQNKQLEKIFKNEKWFQILLECQNEITANNHSKYYIKHYKDSEKCYWSNIPLWLFKDQTCSQKKILDIGCGYGTLSFFCQKIFESDIYCIDSNASNLNKALIKKKNIHFKINNIETDDFPWDEKFDIIIFTEVLEHFNFHPVITLKKIHSLLKPTGKLYLSTPDSHEWGRITKYYKKFEDMPNPKKNVEIIYDHIFQFSKEELLKILENAGFNILEFAYSSGVMNRYFNLMLNKK